MEFRRGNFENMSKMYWRFGLPDINSELDVDIFFQINECDIFKKYHGNEFEWIPLRNTLKDFLEGNSQNFSRHLFFDLPIEVGIYNVEKGTFTVESKNFNSASRDFFPHPAYLNWTKNFCDKKLGSDSRKSYPREAIFRFIRPLSIPNIAVEEQAAKYLVNNWKETKAEKRYLAIRMFISVTKYIGHKDFHNQGNIPVFLTYIEGYEIYENLGMGTKLHDKSYIRKKKKKKSQNLVPTPSEVQSSLQRPKPATENQKPESEAKVESQEEKTSEAETN